jgi:hypothetical protein
MFLFINTFPISIIYMKIVTFLVSHKYISFIYVATIISLHIFVVYIFFESYIVLLEMVWFSIHYIRLMCIAI